MKMIIKSLLIFLFTYSFFISCSSSEETQVKKTETETIEETDSVYVFDEIPPEDLFKLESPVQQSFDVFVIQIGAFSSIDRAKDFADESRNKLDTEIKVEYKSENNLYVVWIYPPFQDKVSAESYRTKIQQSGDFQDAWIVTIESKK